MRLEFNGAMNSIPILLLAMGWTTAAVVLRYREELVRGPRRQGHHGGLLGRGEGQALKTGTVLTSAALVVAIFTDMVGFLSFRLSAQNFLVVFGTVIAIGLFFIYLLSVTALPALLTVLKPQRLALERSSRSRRAPSHGGPESRPSAR